VDPDVAATQIQQQMHAIRKGLRPEVKEIVDSAKTLMSWQHYVASYPWASLGAAAAVGYMVVPRRLEVTRPDAEALKRIARNSKLVLETESEVPAKPTMIASAFALAGTLLLRAGLTYAGRQAGRFFESSAASRRQMERFDDRLPTSDGPSAQRNRFQ
jgi:hypothetical protein